MPSSDFHQIPVILDLVKKLQPKSILDIGFGCGKYGLLLKEKLRDKTFDGWKTNTIIDGIEIYEPYVTKIQRAIYDEIFIGDITKMRLKRKYDLYLMIDVIEHLEKAKGRGLVKLLAKKGKVLVATPYVYAKQTPKHGNVFEKHISHWKIKDFKNFNCENHSIKDCLILLLNL